VNPKSYLLVETRSDLDGPDPLALLRTALELRRGGHQVRLFLIQNGVLMTDRVALITKLAEQGVAVFLDDYSSSARAVDAHRKRPGIEPASAADLVQFAVSQDVITVWH
jgi:hypothetical protein